MIGSGVVAESLAQVLPSQGLDVECAVSDRAAATADALLPDLIVLAGDAAQDRGAAVVAQLSEASGGMPLAMLVICAPDPAGLVSLQSPRNVGYLAPEGGMAECAQRVRALFDLFMEEGLTSCSLQQLADTVAASRAQLVRGVAAPPVLGKSAALQPAPSKSNPLTPAVTPKRGATTQATPLAAASPKAEPATSPRLRAAPAASGATATTQPVVQAAKPIASASRAVQPTAAGNRAPARAATAEKSAAVKSAKTAESKPEAAVEGAAASAAVASAKTSAAKPAPVERAIAKPRPASAPVSAGFGANATPSRAESAPIAAAASTEHVQPAQQVEARPVTARPQPVSPPPLPRTAPSSEVTPEVAAGEAIRPTQPRVRETEALRARDMDTDTDPPIVVSLRAPSQAPRNSNGVLTSQSGSAFEVVVAFSEPAPSAPVRVLDPSSAELDFSVSFSEPAPKAAAAQEAAKPAQPPPLRGRSSTPEPAVASPQLDAPASAPEQPTRAAAPAPVPAPAPAPVPVPVPAPVPVPVPARKAGDVARAARRIGNPLDAPAMVVQPSAATMVASVDVHREPGVLSRFAPLLLCVFAAVGCVTLLYYVRNSGTADALGSRAPLGSLQQAPSGSTPAAPTGSQPVANTSPPRAVSAADPTPSSHSEQPQAVERPTGLARPAGPVREAGPGAEPDRAQLLLNEGIAMSRQGRLGIAEGLFLKSLQATPDDPRAMAELVRVHLARRDGVEALRWANRLVAKQPGLAVHQLLLGDAQALNGDMDAARTAWSAAARSGNALARQRLAAQ